jgi:hypothetical protein
LETPIAGVQWSSGPPQGQYVLVAKAIDRQGGVSWSAPVNVMIGPTFAVWGARRLPTGEALFFYNAIALKADVMSFLRTTHFSPPIHPWPLSELREYLWMRACVGPLSRTDSTAWAGHDRSAPKGVPHNCIMWLAPLAWTVRTSQLGCYQLPTAADPIKSVNSENTCSVRIFPYGRVWDKVSSLTVPDWLAIIALECSATNSSRCKKRNQKHQLKP